MGPGGGDEGLRRLDLNPSEVLSFPRRDSYILCISDSSGLYRYWPFDGREHMEGNYPGLTVNTRPVRNWDDREFSYVVPGVASRLLLITDWR